MAGGNNKDGKKRVLVVGAGAAGMFDARCDGFVADLL
jgi:hypothetical protein